MNNTTLSLVKDQFKQIIANIKASGERYQSLLQVLLLEAMVLAARKEYKLAKEAISNVLRPQSRHPFVGS